MTRILMAGDTHAGKEHLSYLFRTAKRFDADRIFQLGDFGYWPRRAFGQRFLKHVYALTIEYGIPLYWLDGNHEDHNSLDSMVRHNSRNDEGFISTTIPYRGGSHNTVLYAPRGHTWEWDGVKFLAVGGAYSVDKHLRQAGIDWFPEESVTDHDVEIASSKGPVDVMLTHDVPSVSPILEELLIRKNRRYKIIEDAEANRQQLELIRRAVRPKTLIHGHYHVDYRRREDGVLLRGLDCDGTTGFSWTILDTKDILGV